MDYDKTDIAANYDQARSLLPETLHLWLDLLSPHFDRGGSSLIIDLGCGTGRFTEPLAAYFGVQVVGVDPSQKMVDQARRKPATGNVLYRQGSGESVPLPDRCANLLFMSNVYHHLKHPPVVAQECRRMLRHAGCVCIRNGVQEMDFPHRHFFPGLEALIASELPPQREIENVFTGAGFTPVVNQIVTQIIAPNWSGFVEKSALRADSFLARLSDEDFQRGMAALRTHGQKVDPNVPVSEEIGWFVFRTGCLQQ
jgi:ubiquinone/menaquinone biosynthesis C-methylase UbiE